jgi:hypothetical protein
MPGFDFVIASMSPAAWTTGMVPGAALAAAFALLTSLRGGSMSKAFLVGLGACAAIAASTATVALTTPASAARTHVSRSAAVSRCESWIRARPIFPTAQPGKLLIVSPDSACFEGEIDEDSVVPLLTWLESLPSGTRPLLVVRSRGGEATAGIDVMEALQKTDAEVRGVDLCGSSCADYLFAGARHRSVSDGALILFHGGYSPPGRARMVASLQDDRKPPKMSAAQWAQIRRDSLAQFDRDFARQSELYAKIGVSDAVTRNMDSVKMDELPDNECDTTRTVERKAVFFSVAQLSAMGIVIDHGRPASTPAEANAKLRQLGSPFEVCQAPESIFPEGASRPR